MNLGGNCSHAFSRKSGRANKRESPLVYPQRNRGEPLVYPLPGEGNRTSK
jgi:hypothetical protein